MIAGSIIGVTVAFCDGAENAGGETGLKIYLPRQIVVKDSNIRLDAIGILRGQQSLVSKAGAIGLGMLSVPGQTVVIDRTTILSRLTSNGIMSSEIELSGAESVSVKRQEKIIRGKELIKAAKDFISANPPVAGYSEWETVGTLRDVIIAGTAEDVNLAARHAGSSGRHVKVAVTVVSGGREIAVREVTFLAAKQPLAANSVIQPKAPAPVVLPILVRRDGDVAIEIRVGTLTVRAMGQAMQDGRAGECIKVRNADSKRIITAKVKEDGTVQPVF